MYAGYLGYTFICPEFFTDPIIQDDYALHYANAIEVVTNILGRGVPWGYSTEYCGGRLSFGIDDIWSALFLLLFAPLIGNAIAFNLSILAGFATPPLSIMFLLKSYKCNRMSVFTGTIMTMLAVNGMIPIRSFYYTGCYGFVIATSLCFFLFGILNQYIETKKPVLIVAMVFWGSICILTHPLSAIIFLCLSAPQIIINRKKLKAINVIYIITAGIVSIVLNLFTWLLPLYLHNESDHSEKVTNMQTDLFLIFDILKHNKAFAILLLLFLLSLIKIYRDKSSFDKFPWIISSLIFLLISFFGSQIGLSTIEPSRFIIPLIFLMIVVSSINLRRITFGENVLQLIILAFFIILIIRPMPDYSFGINGFSSAKKMLMVLKNSGDSQGRVLFQDSYDHPYFDCHFSALIPVYTNRETTANTYRLNYPVYPQFVENRLFGSTLEHISESQLKHNFKLFNISHIVTYNIYAKEFFDTSKLVEPLAYIENFAIYTTKNFEDNLCFDCIAEIEAENGIINVRNAIDTVTILKYHYFKALKTIPDSLTIEPVFLSGDPTPFVRVRNGTATDFQIMCRR